MRCLSAFALLVVATPAIAQEAPSQPPQLTLVEVFETSQALVFDRVERQYLVVRTGAAVQGFRVASIQPQQIELVRAEDGTRSYIVTLPAPRAAKATPAPIVSAPAPTPAPGPAFTPAPEPTPAPAPQVTPAPEPDTAPAANSDGPLDPYAGATRLPEREIEVVQAPPESRPPETREPTVVTAPTPSGPTTATPASPPAPAQPAGPAVLARGELDTSLTDLDDLSSQIDLRLTKAGVVVERVSAGSLGHRLGLRAGDLVRSVAGIPVRKLEDGADIYVRLGQVDRFDIAITRGTRRMNLPVVIK